MTDRQTHTHTDRQTDASNLIICSMLCYSNGTDNNILFYYTWCDCVTVSSQETARKTTGLRL